MQGGPALKAEELLSVLHTANRLKDTTRHCWTPGNRHESVADHSWRLALTAFFLRDEFPDTDMDKVIKMCLIHDLGECFTGDIPSFLKTDADTAKEDALLIQWVETLPQPYRTEMAALYAEMDALETPEAKLYKALDKLEAVIAHNESPISSWLPREVWGERHVLVGVGQVQVVLPGQPGGDGGLVVGDDGLQLVQCLIELGLRRLQRVHLRV